MRWAVDVIRFMLREKLLLQSTRTANHNQNSYIGTQCEEAHLILRQVSEVRSFHPIALSWQRPSTKGESCPRSVIPPPDSLPRQEAALSWPYYLPGPGKCMHRATMLEMCVA